jgi:hypothetical protein
MGFLWGLPEAAGRGRAKPLDNKAPAHPFRNSRAQRPESQAGVEQSPMKSQAPAPKIRKIPYPPTGTILLPGAFSEHPATWSSPHSPCASAGHFKRLGPIPGRFFLGLASA